MSRSVACPVAPVLITQENCQGAVGLPPRRFLQLVAGHPRVVKLGKLRALEVADVVALVRERAGTNDNAPPQDGAARVLAVLGRRRAG